MSNYARILSWQTSSGLQATDVVVEALKSRGLQGLSISGLPDAWLKEGRDRLRALVSAHSQWGPLDRILVQLLPADEEKAGAQLEFPIVAACLLVLAEDAVHPRAREALARRHLVGAVALNGDVQANESTKFLERIYADTTWGPSDFPTLAAFLDFLTTGIDPVRRLPEDPVRSLPIPTPKVVGRRWERAWLLTALVLRRPVLLMGPPGVGKSFLASWAGALHPAPLETTWRSEIESLWGLAGFIRAPQSPHLTPHSRTHLAEFIGYARRGSPRPGLFSLAHGGTLVLDEFAELNRDCREIMRTVLDQKRVIRQTPKRACEWPADFWLLATCNPCPCGHARGPDLRDCRCGEVARRKYRDRLSGPLLDRFAIKLHVDRDDQTKDRLFPEATWLDESPLTVTDAIRTARTKLAEAAPRESYSMRSFRSRRLKDEVHAALQALWNVTPERASELIHNLETHDEMAFTDRPLPVF